VASLSSSRIQVGPPEGRLGGPTTRSWWGPPLPKGSIEFQPREMAWRRYSYRSSPVTGRSLLYVAEMSARADIRIFSFDSGQSTTVVSGLAARFVSSGHLLYVESRGNLMVMPFDPDSPTSTASPVSLDTLVRVHVSGAAAFDVSRSGSLIYLPAGAESRHSLVWVDRDGNATPASGEKRAYSAPKVSPNGRKVAVAVGVGTSETNVWVLDLERDILSPLTSQGTNIVPIWSPDGEWIYFSSTREGSQAWDIYRKASDARQRDPAEPILEMEGFEVGINVSPDGGSLIMTEGGPQGDILLLPLTKGALPQPFLASEAIEGMPTISPDGRWVAYVSNETGREEIYVRPFTGSVPVVQVSRDGGRSPIWARTGDELYYRRGPELRAVEVEMMPEFRLIAEQLLFEIDDVKTVETEYDVAPDGRFLMVVNEQRAGNSSFNLVLNWAEEIRREGSQEGR